MSWTIGSVTLPVPPNRISYKSPNTGQKIDVHIESPWIFHMGPDVGQIQLRGEIFHEDDSLATLDTNYVNQLHRYSKYPMAVDVPLLDISGHGDWLGDGVTTIKNTGVNFVKNDESLYVQFGGQTNEIYYQLDQDTDFSDQIIVSIWVKGPATNKFKLTFYNEQYGDRNDGYRMYINAGSSNTWNQNIASVSSEDGTTVFNDVNSPEGWDKIRSIVIEPSGFNPGAGGYCFDALMIGTGWVLSAPRSLYDGIWYVKDFQTDEIGGNIHSYEWRMTLLDKRDYFGLSWKAV